METEETATIREPVVREMVQVDPSLSATVTGQERGFAVRVRLGNGEKVLVTSRGAIRLFASLDTAGTFVKDLGIPRFDVDMSNHEPGRLRKARPDRAEALRRTGTKPKQQPLEFTSRETL